MMWILTLTIFITFKGSYCMRPKCADLIRVECGVYDITKILSLGTIEELKTFCSTFISYGHCSLKGMEKCEQDMNMRGHEGDLENSRKIMRFVELSCEEDNRVFKAIANNLNCVMSTWHNMDDICYLEGLNNTQKEKLSILAAGRFACNEESWMYYCKNAKFDVECGNDVRDAVAQILEEVNYVSRYCKETRSKLLYFEAAFKTEFRRGNYGEVALPRIFETIIKQSD